MPPRRTKLLSSSRPPAKVSTAISSSTANLSSKRTRAVIRTHHTLQKQLSRAIAANDETAITELEGQIQENGGLRMYQKASTIGQGRERGGDTSKVLVEWLGEQDGGLPHVPLQSIGARNATNGKGSEDRKLRILEVGALSTQNALNVSAATKVRRIDLRSQHREIEQVDFMQLDADEQWQGERGYDVLSLSLVVNFVGDARARGEMLRHTVGFLRHSSIDGEEASKKGKELLPALFLVLPLPCVDNSRYLTEEHLTSVMEGLGYEETRAKRSGKLYYSLWRLQSPAGSEKAAEANTSIVFKKEELRKGKDRNNFCIMIDNAG